MNLNLVNNTYKLIGERDIELEVYAHTDKIVCVNYYDNDNEYVDSDTHDVDTFIKNIGILYEPIPNHDKVDYHIGDKIMVGEIAEYQGDKVIDLPTLYTNDYDSYIPYLACSTEDYIYARDNHQLARIDRDITIVGMTKSSILIEYTCHKSDKKCRFAIEYCNDIKIISSQLNTKQNGNKNAAIKVQSTSSTITIGERYEGVGLKRGKIKTKIAVGQDSYIGAAING